MSLLLKNSILEAFNAPRIPIMLAGMSVTTPVHFSTQSSKEAPMFSNFLRRATHVKTTVIILIILFFCFAGCSKQPTNEEQKLLDDAVGKKLSTAIEIFKSEGIKGAALYCERRDEIVTRAGNFSIHCSVVADFYDTNEKVMSDGSKMILPVSVYTHVKNALHLLDQGWKFRDATITAFAQGDNSSKISIIKSRKIP